MLADTGVTRVCRMLYTSPNGILPCMLLPPLPYRPFPLNTQLPPARSAGHAGPSQLSWSPLVSPDPPSMFRMSDSLFQPGCYLPPRDSIIASTTGDHSKGSTTGQPLPTLRLSHFCALEPSYVTFLPSTSSNVAKESIWLIGL